MAAINTSVQKPEDGTSFFVRGTGANSTIGQLAGVMKSLTRAEFDKLVTDERSRIAANSTGIYPSGETIGRITGELGERVWTVGTGGSDAANAAASHARKVSYLGKSYTLGADANVFGATTGAPSSGTGANGDYAVDGAAGLIYGPKASGAWPAGVDISGGISVTSLTDISSGSLGGPALSDVDTLNRGGADYKTTLAARNTLFRRTPAASRSITLATGATVATLTATDNDKIVVVLGIPGSLAVDGTIADGFTCRVKNRTGGALTATGITLVNASSIGMGTDALVSLAASTTEAVVVAAGTGVGGPGSDTTAARLTDSRFLGIERIDLKARYGAFADGTVHPLSGDFASLAAAQAVYPNAGLTGSNWSVMARDSAAFAQAEYDIRTATSGAGIIGLADNCQLKISQPLVMSLADKVWFHGGRNSIVQTSLVTSAPAMQVLNSGNLNIPLKGLSFQAKDVVSGLVQTPGSAGAGYAPGTQLFFIDNVRGSSFETLSWVNYDRPFKWGNHTFGVRFSHFAAGLNNYGLNWTETSSLDSMEKMIFEWGSLSNNNRGYHIDALFGPDANGVMYSQGGSWMLDRINFDYNQELHGYYRNTANQYAIGSLRITNAHIETTGGQSGTANARFVNQGSMFLLNSEFCENGGGEAAGGIEALEGSYTNFSNNRVNATQMPLILNRTFANVRWDSTGNCMQDAYALLPTAYRYVNHDGTYQDFLQRSMNDASSSRLLDPQHTPFPFDSSLQACPDFFCHFYNGPQTITLDSVGWPDNSTFRVWCWNSPITFAVKSGILTTFPSNSPRLTTPGTFAVVKRNGCENGGEWIVTGPLVA